MALVGNISGSGGISNTIGITGSLIIANPGLAAFPGFPGTDTVFFVSGARDGKEVGSRTVSVFGGDTVISGSLTIGTGSIRIDSNEIRFQGGIAKIISGSGGLTFFDSGTPSGVTLSSLAGGGGDVTGPASSTDTAIVRFNGVTGKVLQSSGVTISATDDVVIPGNLTVNGTTTTVNTDNLVVRDQLIYIASSSIAGTVTYGGLARASGSGTTNEALVFVKDGTGTGAVWSAGRQDVVSGTVTTNAGLTYLPIRASSFQLGGTLGSAVAAGSAFLSSSDALNVLVNHTATTTFTKSGTPTVQIGTYDTSNEGLIKGVTTAGALSDLWLSGTAVSIGSTMTSFIGADGQRRGTISGSAGGQGLILTAQDGTFTPRTLTLSGSGLELGAASQGMLLKFAGADRGSFTATGNSLTFGTPSTVSLTLSGANGVSVIHGGLGTGFIKDFGGAAYLNVEADINDARLRAPGNIILRADGADIKFSSGSTTTQLTLNLAGNNASFKGAANQQVNIGSDGAGGGMTVSGSTVTVNVGPPGFVFQRDGVNSLHVNALSTLTKISGSAAQSVTLAAGTGATTLTLSGSTVVHSASIAHKFNLNTTLVAHVTESSQRQGIFPGQDSLFDLGGPTLRWANMYTGDLHLKNERGDWTVIEEEDYLSITNNKSGKRYKFVLQEI